MQSVQLEAPATKLMLDWQLRKLIGQSLLLQDHCIDVSCPCEADESIEYCIPKTLIAIQAYAEETYPMTDKDELKAMLEKIGGGANDLRRAYEEAREARKEPPYAEIATFARDARKELEPFLWQYKAVVSKQENMRYPMPTIRPLIIGEDAPTIKGIIPSEFASLKVQTKLVRSKAYDPEKVPRLARPEDVQPFFRLMRNADQEWLLAIYVNTKGAVVGADEISIGTKDSTIVAPEVIFRSAILTNASAIFLAHNHPSGDPTPSPEDLDIYERMRTGCPILGIPVNDFFVVGFKEDYSIAHKRKIPALALFSSMCSGSGCSVLDKSGGEMEMAQALTVREREYLRVLPDELFETAKSLAGARYALDKRDYGKVFDHIVTAQTIVHNLVRAMPITALRGGDEIKVKQDPILAKKVIIKLEEASRELQSLARIRPQFYDFYAYLKRQVDNILPALTMDEKEAMGEGEVKMSDPILTEVISQICSTGICLAEHKKDKLPICTPARTKKLEKCIVDVKAKLPEMCKPHWSKPPGKQPEGCVNPWAVCRAAIGCRLGGSKEYEKKEAKQ